MPKPTAEEIKRQARRLLTALPQEAHLGKVLTTLANHEAVMRMLVQTYPAASREDLRRALADTAALLESMRAWMAPAKSAQGPASEAPADLSDPSVLARVDKVKVHIDGASKGNPGPSSVGVVITDLENNPLFEDAKYLGRMTNNAAEYNGLIHALGILVENGSPEAYVFSDSLLLVNQMNLDWRVKHPGIKPLFTRAQQLKRKLPRFQITHISREKNSRADKLANLAIKQALDAQAM